MPTTLYGTPLAPAPRIEPRPRTQPAHEQVFVTARYKDESETRYIIDPHDEITVHSPNIKEIDEQKQVVRPDGKIALNLLGEVAPAGKTPRQVNELLQKMAEKYYVHPDIKIDVVANSKFYQVVLPGKDKPVQQAYTSNDCILNALAAAGFNEDRWPARVSLARATKNGSDKPNTVIVDCKKIFEYGDLEQNYHIEEGDVIDAHDSPLFKPEDADKILGPFTGEGSAVRAGKAAFAPASTQITR